MNSFIFPLFLTRGGHSPPGFLRTLVQQNATLMELMRQANMYDHILYSEAKRLFWRAYARMQMAEEYLFDN